MFRSRVTLCRYNPFELDWNEQLLRYVIPWRKDNARLLLELDRNNWERKLENVQSNWERKVENVQKKIEIEAKDAELKLQKKEQELRELTVTAGHININFLRLRGAVNVRGVFGW